jgi:hypothetical protein
MAQDLLALNVAMPAIMQAGEWTNEHMVARYTTDTNAEQGTIAVLYATGKLR